MGCLHPCLLGWLDADTCSWVSQTFRKTLTTSPQQSTALSRSGIQGHSCCWVVSAWTADNRDLETLAVRCARCGRFACDLDHLWARYRGRGAPSQSDRKSTRLNS